VEKYNSSFSFIAVLIYGKSKVSLSPSETVWLANSFNEVLFPFFSVY